MDEHQFRTLSSLWFSLLRNKEIYVKRVHNRISKEKLSKTDLKKPEISQQIKQFGYYDVVTTKTLNEIKILEQLTAIGYLEKRVDKIYKIHLFYDAHPYLPHVDIDGYLGIQLNTKYHFTYRYLNSKKFANFVETSKLFVEGLNAGLHRHIQFGYGVDFSYETEVYEIKDKYFDALFVGTKMDVDFPVHLCQPFIQSKFSSKETKYTKNWKPGKGITLDDFLKGLSVIDPMIDELEWKKKIYGYLMFEEQPYQILVSPKGDKNDDKNMLNAPDFFDTGEFSPENMRSRLFEEITANYIQTMKYISHREVKYHGKEIDIFSEKFSEDGRDLIISECKLRLEDAHLTVEELEIFNEKRELVLENEVFNKCEFWLVSNTDNLMDGVKEYSDAHDIKIKMARLPKNWKARSDWSINNLSTL